MGGARKPPGPISMLNLTYKYYETFRTKSYVNLLIHLKTKTKSFLFQDENKHDAHRVRNFIGLPIFMFSIIFTWNSTTFWPKKLFSTSKTGRVILFPLYPHIFFWKNFNFISRWNCCEEQSGVQLQGCQSFIVYYNVAFDLTLRGLMVARPAATHPLSEQLMTNEHSLIIISR